MNKVIMVGNVTKDAELSYVGENGSAKCFFTIAINERISKDKEKTTFVPCTIWGKMAESISPYILKGNKVAVSGKLEINSVETEYENEYKTYVSVNINELDFCGGKKEDKPKKEETPKKEKKKR